MPHHPSFTQLRRTQRLLGTALGAMIAVAMGAVMLGWAVGALPGIWVALLSGLTLVIMVISVTGYTLLHSQIETADTAMQVNLASAHTDALTGTYTRSYFLEIVRRRLFGDTAQALGYMQIDMDKLKVLNDTMGHGAGDQALVHLVKVIRRLMPEAIIGRLGGDEFGIVLADMDNKGALRRLGDEILRQLTDPIHISGRALRLSATIGVAVAPHDAADMDDLISKADLALYTGKRTGRSTSVAFEEDMLGDERHRRFVERELRAAILMNELQLHYQPIFAPDGKTLRSFEALVRWQHGVRGMIAPGAFIPVAEMSDLIDRLGDWVLRRACADMDRLVALGARSVAINISPVQLRRHDFVQRFAQILATCGVPPARLVVEVTETAPLLAGGIEAGNLAALRAMGVRIAIDDFGAGYASLHYLRDFAFDIIKIDRSYVANIVTSRIDAMIVRTTCKFARSLPAEIIAEGVETPAQLALLRRAGCTGMQGFLLGRPQPLQLLEQRAREPAIASAA